MFRKTSCRAAFRWGRLVSALLWPLLTPHDKLYSVFPKKYIRTSVRPPAVRLSNRHPIYPHHLLCRIRVAFGLRFV